MGDMVKGNIAFGEAALRAGMDFFAGYPITPSTEVMEYLSYRAEECGAGFIQAESELAAINMLMGAAACGKRALTASSGPGLALMQEGLSYMANYDLYCVILNVVRFGAGLGDLKGAQTDYIRDTRGGGEGDYTTIVLVPATIQEGVDLIYDSFDLAEKYRVSVILMTEGSLGQMMEPCEYPPFKKGPAVPWTLDGKYTNKRPDRRLKDFHKERDRFVATREAICANEQRFEAFGLEDADYVLVACGLPGRAVMGAVKALRQQGEKVGYIRPITVFPFPERAFTHINKQVRGIVSVETNYIGQMNIDVALTTKRILGNVPVYTFPYISGIPTMSMICQDYFQVKEGIRKEDL